MLRIMIVLGLLVLVPAVILFWRMSNRSSIDPAVTSGMPAPSSKPIGTSTLSHGNPSPSSADRGGQNQGRSKR